MRVRNLGRRTGTAPPRLRLLPHGSARAFSSAASVLSFFPSLPFCSSFVFYSFQCGKERYVEFESWMDGLIVTCLLGLMYMTISSPTCVA